MAITYAGDTLRKAAEVAATYAKRSKRYEGTALSCVAVEAHEGTVELWATDTYTACHVTVKCPDAELGRVVVPAKELAGALGGWLGQVEETGEGEGRRLRVTSGSTAVELAPSSGVFPDLRGLFEKERAREDSDASRARFCPDYLARACRAAKKLAGAKAGIYVATHGNSAAYMRAAAGGVSFECVTMPQRL